ncbi:alkaline phosphatase family protein [Streptomyces sp. NPDC020917]|uniref:alkaline phosphatase family protein n=1 Tax=Streptomyces sp. NPDC020917 TaxID=3365102 RepID=UPI0037AA96A3
MEFPRPMGRGVKALMACTLLACTALAGVATTAAADDPPPAAGQSVSTEAMPRPDHVVMVMMENKSYDQILGRPSGNPGDQDPYMRSLAAEGVTLTNSHGIQHPSLPNYYALLSASNIVTTNDYPAPSSVDTDNLANELVTHGYSFSDYADQARPTQWFRFKTTPGTAQNLNPMDKRLAQFPSTPDGFASMPTVSFVVGNGHESSHDGSIAESDAWVKSKFDSYINWAKTHNSLFILTYDEDDGGPTNQIPTIMVGPMAKAGSYDEYVNHYSVLRTVLDMYGLPHINHTADAGINTVSDAFDLSRTEHLSGRAGRCAADQPTGEEGHDALSLRHCESAANQQWIRHADGTIRVKDQCMTATGGGTAITLAACDGTAPQVWQPQNDGSLMNTASGLCLDDPGASINNGAALDLKDCDGTLGQKWHVPSFVPPHQLTLGGSVVVNPGSAATVTTTYTNSTSPTPLKDASIGLTVPNGWSAKATTPTDFTAIAPGKSATTTWTVTAPADAAPDSYPLTMQATYAGAASSDQTSARITVPYASEAAARNNVGISDNNTPGAGNIDGGNRSFSAQTLAAVGLTPGAKVTHDGLTFTWPNAAPGTPDNINIVGNGQTFPLTGPGDTLGFLATGAGDTSGVGTITYTDGTTQPYSLTINDWTSTSAAPGSDTLVVLPYRNRSAGVQNLPVRIYGATVALQPGKTVAYLTLPNAAGMHIFSTAIG